MKLGSRAWDCYECGKQICVGEQYIDWSAGNPDEPTFLHVACAAVVLVGMVEQKAAEKGAK